MKLAFCLFKYFPFGGLQRDFLRITQECADRGHDIHVFTMKWEGKRPNYTINEMAPRGLQNHQQGAHFVKQLKKHFSVNQYDLTIGFNKIPDLDWYYAADICYQSRITHSRSFLYRLLPRYRRWQQLENSVFKRGAKTKIMLIAHQQQEEFIRYYQTEPERFFLLPPGIVKNQYDPNQFKAPDQVRKSVRAMYDIADHTHLLLMVGSGFKTKGLDRTLKAIAALPLKIQSRCRLFVIGTGNPRPFLELAKQLYVDHLIHFLGGRSDVSQFLLSADLLIHPSYHENTGTVLLEAMVSGLPVLTLNSCGYGQYIHEAKAGVVLNNPFNQKELNRALTEMLSSNQHDIWRRNGLAYAELHDLYSMPQKAADLIERLG
ncbi:MAG: glycosyltransferase family 4 protein [Gammaproteobacteria bacterium]|nr:glycosyltransferase family 4 protein [Gammaproteobacteria bacterium]